MPGCDVSPVEVESPKPGDVKILPLQYAFRAAKSEAPLHGLLVHPPPAISEDHADESEPEQAELKVTPPVVPVLREEAVPPKGVLQVPDPVVAPDWNTAKQEIMQPNMFPVDVWRTTT